MRKLLLLLAVVCLNGCSVAVLSSIWPKPHDPVMFDSLVSTKMALDDLSCDDKTWAWETAETRIKHLKVYSSLRNDPQAQTIAQLEEAIGKAKKSDNKLFCESILKINKTRIDVVVDAWKGR